MSVYFFWGEEDYLITKELEKYRAKLDKNFAQMNYVTYDKLSYSDLISVLRTQPMMFGKMMIVIYTRELLQDKGTKRQSLLSAALEDSQIKEIEDSLDIMQTNNGELLDIFFVEIYNKTDKTKKPDARKKLYKVLSKYTEQKFEKIPAYKTAELSNIINNLAKEKKVKINQDAIDALISSKGSDLRAFDMELDKLAIYAHPQTTITKDMVKDICTDNEDLFNLTDYLMTQKKEKALIELRRLLVTKYPLEILSTLQTMVKRWIYMKLNSNKMSYSEIGLKLGRLHEYVVKLSLENMKDVSVKSLVQLKKNLTEAEYKIKTGQAYSPEEELENAIIR